MFDETRDWDDLEVKVVVEHDGEPVEGCARGAVTSESRLEIVARAALAAASAAAGHEVGTLLGVATPEVAGVSFLAVVLRDAASGEPLVGTAPLRYFEDPAQAAIRGVFDATNRRSEP
jgi:hypothetical protein